MNRKGAVTLQAAIFTAVATLACIGLFSLLGEAAEWVLGAAWFGAGMWCVWKEMAKRRG